MSDAMDYSLFADLYDAYVRSDLDVPFFLQEARQVRGGVLELMSGTGRVSLPLLEAGVNLTCVDASPDMLQYLREKVLQRGLEARVEQMDVRELQLGGQFDLIFIPFHAFAELHSREDQQRTLEKIHLHLSEEGTFICTLHNPAVRLNRVDGLLRLWANVPLDDLGGKLLVWGLETQDTNSASVNGMQLFEVYDPNGLLETKRVVEYRFRIIERSEFETLAQASGFRVKKLYGDYAHSPFDERSSPFMIWKLEKV